MSRALPESVRRRVAEGLQRHSGRILCLAPPGELGPLTALYLGAQDPDRRVEALLAGEPYLHGPLPGGLGIVPHDPGLPLQSSGPFDLVVAWGSEPFVGDYEAWLRSLLRALRPGGRLQLDLPAAGFCPLLQAAHPDAAHWNLPQASTLEALATEAGVRELEVGTWVELRQFQTLGDLVDDVVRPFPLHFDGAFGERRLATLRKALATGLEGAEELSLALRRVRLRGMR